MFISVSLKSKNKTLNGLMGVPLLGPFLVALYAFLPLVLVGVWGDLTAGPTHQTALMLGSILALAWNRYLETIETIITIFWIPAWIWAIISLVLIMLGEVT